MIPSADTLHTLADEAERLGQFPDALAHVFREAGWWKLWVPRAYGGAEMPLAESMEVIERLARIDGALGWGVALGAGGGLFAAWLPDETACAVFASEGALVAGSGAPTGTRRAVPGGWRVDGRWSYASLVDHATWLTGVTLDDGGATPLAFAVPAERARIARRWDTWALRGTGSHDVLLDDAWVPRAFTFDLAQPPRLDGPLYRFPFMLLATFAFAAVGVGLGEGAVERFEAHEGARVLRGTDGVRALDQPAVRERFDGLRQAVGAMRSEVHAQADACWARVGRGEALTPGEEARATRACIAGLSAVWQAADALADAGGMGILYADNRWGRIWRNLRGLRQHMLLSPLRTF